MEPKETSQRVTDEQGQVSTQAEPKDKEAEIQQITQILQDWPTNRISFLRESLENLRKPSKDAQVITRVAAAINKASKKVIADIEAERGKKLPESIIDYAISDIKKALRVTSVEGKPEALKIVLAETVKDKTACEEIAKLNQEVERICDLFFDTKTKAALAMLDKINDLNGVSNAGLDYANNILFGYGRADIEKAKEEFPDDSNIAFLSHIYNQAVSVLDFENQE